MRFALAFVLALTCSAPAAAPSDYDVRIINGEIIDGTGAKRIRADLGIRGDTIAKIGDLSRATSKITIDAAHQVVTPGFIDLLGHSEFSILIDPNLEGKVRQGVTTEVTGEGHSPGPIDDKMAAEIDRTRLPGFPDATWRSLGDFMRVVEAKHSAINFAFYIGAANPREIVIGTADRPPTAEELAKMEQIVDKAKRDGAIGLSTALIYPPGRFATTEELIALAKHGGGYWTHLRNEANNILPALDEAFRIGREAHVPVNVFHLKVGGAMKGHMSEVVAKIESARKSGLDVASQIYPYTATSTDLTSTVPAWALDGGYLKFVERLKEPDTRAKIAAEIRVGDGSGILVRNLPRAPQPMLQYERKRLDAIAKAMNATPAKAALRQVGVGNSSPLAIFFRLTGEDHETARRQPWGPGGSGFGQRGG